MKKIIYGQDDRVMDWVKPRIDVTEFGHGSIAIGHEQDGELISGTVYNMYSGPSICMHVAAEPGKLWLTRDFLFRSFAYPFLQLKCHRVTGLVRVDNLAAQKLDEHLGFVKEGVLRRGAADGTDMIIYGMLREECRWLGVKQ